MRYRASLSSAKQNSTRIFLIERLCAFTVMYDVKSGNFLHQIDLKRYAYTNYVRLSPQVMSLNDAQKTDSAF